MEAPVPSGFPVGFEPLRRVLEEGFHLRVVLRGELSRDCSVDVVESHRAGVSAAPRWRRARSLRRPDQGGKFPNGAGPSRISQLLVGLGRGGVDDSPDLVEGHITVAQRLGQSRQVVQALGHVRPRSRRGERDPAVFGCPGVERGRTVFAEPFAPPVFAQEFQEPTRLGRDLATHPRDVVSDLFRRLLPRRLRLGAIHVSRTVWPPSP